MALTPETIDALKSALEAVVAEAGDDPQYGELVTNLTGATEALDSIDDQGGADPDKPPADAEPAEPKDEPADDEDAPPDNFKDAEVAFGKRMAKKREAGA